MIVENFPTPHLQKLNACLNNQRLPASERARVEEAVERYGQWIAAMEEIEPHSDNSVERLVQATNEYKKYVELNLIFDSPENFLYRQKGQLKLDNTIIEEFLPHLIARSVVGPNEVFEMGPRKTFSGLSFSSTVGDTGKGGSPIVRSKDQDFILGKRLFVKTGFDSAFENSTTIESHLGYVCIECKTNLDKTMFQEAVATSRDLKIAVPGSLYFLACEFLDMTPVSITSTQIDDVLILRKAKRMSSNVRQEYRTPADRRNHRDEYERFLDASMYHPDVFKRMINKIQSLINQGNPSVDSVLDRGYF